MFSCPVYFQRTRLYTYRKGTQNAAFSLGMPEVEAKAAQGPPVNNKPKKKGKGKGKGNGGKGGDKSNAASSGSASKIVKTEKVPKAPKVPKQKSAAKPKAAPRVKVEKQPKNDPEQPPPKRAKLEKDADRVEAPGDDPKTNEVDLQSSSPAPNHSNEHVADDGPVKKKKREGKRELSDEEKEKLNKFLAVDKFEDFKIQGVLALWDNMKVVHAADRNLGGIIQFKKDNKAIAQTVCSHPWPSLKFVIDFSKDLFIKWKDGQFPDHAVKAELEKEKANCLEKEMRAHIPAR